MDKEAFLQQLESAVLNNNKKLFIDSIFDLPAEVIVGFTKEELSRIFTISRQIDLHDVDEMLSFLGDEGYFSLKNALEGIDELNNFLLCKFYYSLSISLVVNNIKIAKAALLNSSLACCKLAEMGVDCSENFGITLRFCEDAKKILPKGSSDYAGAFSTEGLAYLKLGEMGVDCKKNFEAAICCCGTAQKIFHKESLNYARALMNEGTARLNLAKIGVAKRENLETAILCYDTAKKILTKKGADYAGLLINKGLAKQGLAKLDVEMKENLETAVSLFEASRKILPKISSVYAKSLMNEGNARRALYEMNIKSEENFKMSMNLYIESISIYEKIGDGWTYSIALLNLNNLLKLNFYKTGDIKYFEEWEKYIGNIDEMIKSRDLMHKDLLMTRIHEVHASLLEFKGNSGISDASFEYYEAYKISKEPFFKFMKEFCQARNGEKSFCKLASDWKEVEKKFIFLDYDIFLDYYDYGIFECHMENAIKSTIDEENELKLAVEKLKEIRDRTLIKVIKDRASAYIHLLQALVDCFTEESYNEASENVKTGCRIFKEYEDKQGQEMCGIFHNAVVKNRDPNAWQDIIRRREFSSNFYSLLCEYSDRKRANLEFYSFGQMQDMMGTISKDMYEVKNDLKDIKEKIDHVFVYLRPGIKEEIEISVGAEYLGTGAKHIIRISLQDISYADLKEDLDKIAGKSQLSKMPVRLVNKIKDYLIRHGDKEMLDKLT